MELMRKAKARGLNIGNIISWLSLGWLSWFGRLWGTVRLQIKARILGVQIGHNVSAHGPVGLLRWPGGQIHIGDKASFISSWRRSTAAALAWPCRLRVFGPGASIEIGEGCQLSGTSITARSTTIRIGNGVLFAPNCIIVDSDFHAPWPANERADKPGYENDKGVEIGDYAWIGMGSVILKGVKIGEGAIIGAGSVVTKDIPANCLAAGSPATVIRVGPKNE